MENYAKTAFEQAASDFNAAATAHESAVLNNGDLIATGRALASAHASVRRCARLVADDPECYRQLADVMNRYRVLGSRATDADTPSAWKQAQAVLEQVRQAVGVLARMVESKVAANVTSNSVVQRAIANLPQLEKFLAGQDLTVAQREVIERLLERFETLLATATAMGTQPDTTSPSPVQHGVEDLPEVDSDGLVVLPEDRRRAWLTLAALNLFIILNGGGLALGLLRNWPLCIMTCVAIPTISKWFARRRIRRVTEAA